MFAWRALPPPRRRADAGPGEDGLPGPGAYLTVPALATAGIRVAFTTRHGGASDEPNASLNLSLVAGDDPGTVRRNRARALEAIGAPPDAWTSGQQVHGATVARATAGERGRGAFDPGDTLADTDAIWTDTPGVALVVLTADCVPLLVADPGARRLAVAHCGWRGLVSGIVERAVGAMGASADAVALIGPSIGPCCYEVGPDVADPAREAFGPDVVRAPREGRTAARVDLWGATASALRRSGIGDIRESALCTRCEPHRFFSHRAGHSARQGVLAWIQPG